MENVKKKATNWRPFAEARAFVHKLNLRNEDEWRSYCKSGKKPDDIPAKPSRTYSTEFKGFGDWLGTGYIACRDRVYLPFTEARAFVQALGLKNSDEWRSYCKSGKKPDHIPASPIQVYGSEFKGMGDWLGTGYIANRSRAYLPFEEARSFVHILGFNNRAEWQAYCKSGKKPDDIPANPIRVYKSEFRGMGDWLGTEYVHPSNRAYRSFAEARAFVHTLRLRNQKAWKNYCKSGEKPDNIPSHPDCRYSSEFRGMGDWLGTEYVHPSNRVYRSFAEARAFVHILGFNSRAEWQAYCKSGEKPDDIPAGPHRVYGARFKGMGDWLGTGYIANRSRAYLPFEEARSFVRTLRLRNYTQWQAYCKSGKKPDDIPANPIRVYSSEFESVGDWLGTGYVANLNRVYLPFEEARAFVRTLGLKYETEWRAYCLSGKKPDSIPANPIQVYSSEYKGIGDWLGSISRWNRNALLALLHDLRPQLAQLEERELYVILQQGGALPRLRIALGIASPMQVLKDLKDNDGKVLEQALRDISDEEIVIPADDSIVSDVVVDMGDLASLDVSHIFEKDTAGSETSFTATSGTTLAGMDSRRSP